MKARKTYRMMLRKNLCYKSSRSNLRGTYLFEILTLYDRHWWPRYCDTTLLAIKQISILLHFKMTILRSGTLPWKKKLSFYCSTTDHEHGLSAYGVHEADGIFLEFPKWTWYGINNLNVEFFVAHSVSPIVSEYHWGLRHFKTSCEPKESELPPQLAKNIENVLDKLCKFQSVRICI